MRKEVGGRGADLREIICEILVYVSVSGFMFPSEKKTGEREEFGGCGGEIWEEMISGFFFFFNFFKV